LLFHKKLLCLLHQIFIFFYKEHFVKNYLKISLLCVVSLPLCGSEPSKNVRRGSDKVRNAFSEPKDIGAASKKMSSELSRSLPIPISKQRDREDRDFQAKDPDKGFSAGDYLSLVFAQGCLPSPQDYENSKR
jgi:hypothetical protein